MIIIEYIHLVEIEDEEDNSFLTLQLIDYILHSLHKMDDFEVNEHIKKLVNLNDLNLSDIQQVIYQNLIFLR